MPSLPDAKLTWYRVCGDRLKIFMGFPVLEYIHTLLPSCEIGMNLIRHVGIRICRTLIEIYFHVFTIIYQDRGSLNIFPFANIFP